MSYQLLDHTADTGIEATGPTLDAAFAAAIDGFAAIVHQDAEVAPTAEATVTVEAGDLEALLFDLLDRLIYLQDAEGRLVCGVPEGGDAVQAGANGEVCRIGASVATAPLDGTTGLLDIKAPTYHEMRVEETDDGWILTYVLDV